MTDQTWQLRHGDSLIGTLTLEGIDMFWTDCHFAPAAAWEDIRPLFTVSQNAWERGDEEAALEADEVIFNLGLALVPTGGGATITEFLLRVADETARFRH
ncbi:hypothetical protein [Kitasatospora mediocidica]|uniref:hypothetical protein n=1 Tax=Kitasatospora mediocidica TaxID=58352 RepID=UPI00055B3925|nr:hypothetical protein [Kitasatospora mediocidica]